MSRTGPSSPYFYLSHAHDHTELGDDLSSRDDPDFWVKAFYSDLVEQIHKRSRSGFAGVVGAYRPCVIDGEDSSEFSAVRTARAFVPLYSPAYLVDTRAKAERSTFMDAPNKFAARGRIVPVLWQPSPDEEITLELTEAASVSPISDYNSKGLFELSRLQNCRTTYLEVVAFLADRIVEVVDGPNGHRVTSSPGPPPREGRSARPRRPFLLTLVATEQASPVYPVARLIAEGLRRLGYEVSTVRYPDRADQATAGVVLLDAGSLTGMAAPLRQRLTDLPEDQFVIAVGVRPGRGPSLGATLDKRLLSLDGHSARLRMQMQDPEPNAAIAREVLGMIRRQSEGERGPRPYPNRTRLRD